MEISPESEICLHLQSFIEIFFYFKSPNMHTEEGQMTEKSTMPESGRLLKFSKTIFFFFPSLSLQGW